MKLKATLRIYDAWDLGDNVLATFWVEFEGDRVKEAVRLFAHEISKKFETSLISMKPEGIVEIVENAVWVEGVFDKRYEDPYYVVQKVVEGALENVAMNMAHGERNKHVFELTGGFPPVREVGRDES